MDPGKTLTDEEFLTARNAARKAYGSKVAKNGYEKPPSNSCSPCNRQGKRCEPSPNSLKCKECIERLVTCPWLVDLHRQYVMRETNISFEYFNHLNLKLTTVDPLTGSRYHTGIPKDLTRFYLEAYKQSLPSNPNHYDDPTPHPRDNTVFGAPKRTPPQQEATTSALPEPLTTAKHNIVGSDVLYIDGTLPHVSQTKRIGLDNEIDAIDDTDGHHAKLTIGLHIEHEDLELSLINNECDVELRSSPGVITHNTDTRSHSTPERNTSSKNDMLLENMTEENHELRRQLNFEVFFSLDEIKKEIEENDKEMNVLKQRKILSKLSEIASFHLHDFEHTLDMLLQTWTDDNIPLRDEYLEQFWSAKALLDENLLGANVL